jgi:hypothetical protein
MDGPQSFRRKPVNPAHHLIDRVPSRLLLNSLNFGSVNDGTARKALLDDDTDVETIELVHDTQPLWKFTNELGWELLAWITSLIALSATIAILLRFNQKPLSQWRYFIKLNTIVSIFAQISSTALIIPLSGCINQLKWLWFTRWAHPLEDFDSFDKASRGPLASLLLVWTTRAR